MEDPSEQLLYEKYYTILSTSCYTVIGTTRRNYWSRLYEVSAWEQQELGVGIQRMEMILSREGSFTTNEWGDGTHNETHCTERNKRKNRQ